MGTSSRRLSFAFALFGQLLVSHAAVAVAPYEIVELNPSSEQVAGTEGKTLLAGTGDIPHTVLGQGYGGEIEPNGSFATATPLGGANVVVRGNIFPNADVDWYSFTAAAGDRVYAALMTSSSAAGGTGDSQLRLFQSDGTTLIEFDDNDGSLASASSSLADVAIATAGTYFLEVRHTSATSQLRPYELHFRLQSGAPTPEVEANDTPATANVLPAGGWVSGTRNPAAATEQDWYSFTAAAGDTVFLSLDLDPERDNVQWDGRLGIALFGDAANQILVVNDASVGSVANPLSEALIMTVKAAGTYYAFVDSAGAAVGGPTATYTLSVSIRPAVDEGVNCTTYTSTNVPQTIGPNAGLVSSTITVPGNPRIADLDVSIVLDHAFMSDIDAHLRSPAGNDNGLFTDIGAASAGGQTQMDVTFDDEAGIPPLFTVLRGPSYKPELAYRLSWFDGENAGGTWTLDLRDDAAGDGGTLTSWSLRICEAPPTPVCAAGFVPQTVFSSDFEGGAAGFTHSGTGDQWALGLPNTPGTTTANPVAAFTTCNSGVSCWKTNLTGTYNVSTVHDLLSPNISLAGLSAPVVVTWAQRYQMESASFDHLFVDYQQAGGATPVRLFEWLDATMTNGPGSPTVNVPASAGWGVFSRRADSLAGLNTELRFHVDSDITVNFAGLAIDDVAVTACRPLSADLSIIKTDGVTTAVPGGSVTYTITASNAGPDSVTGATVTDTFPAVLTCTWTCVGAGGGTCTAVGSGNLGDTVNLPAGGNVTYTASCTISAAATGTLANTATVSSAVVDPVPGNNSATDTDTLTPQADLAITKTDGLTTGSLGQATAYTIVVSNAGPSSAPGSSVADVFPAGFSGANWTCAGAGGGTCTAGPVAGNLADTANLPAGGSVTYTATGTLAGSPGALSNTATVATGAGVTDPNPGNNSATDTTTIAANPANVTGTKSAAGTFTVGSTVTYTVVLTNSGAGAQLDNPGDEFTDVLPATLALVSATATSGTAVATIGTNTVTWNGSIPAAGTVTLTLTATVNAGTLGQTISNQGTISYDGDGNGTNESTSSTDDPAVGGVADPTLFVVTGSVLEIPTLSGIGFAALALALAGLALARLRRRTV